MKVVDQGTEYSNDLYSSNSNKIREQNLKLDFNLNFYLNNKIKEIYQNNNTINRNDMEYLNHIQNRIHSRNYNCSSSGRRNTFQNNNKNKVYNNIVFIETKKYLLMNKLKNTNENFALKTTFNPNKMYTVYKSHKAFHINADKNISSSKKKLLKVECENKFTRFKSYKNLTISNTKKRKNANKKSLSTRKISNIKLNLDHSIYVPKMRISKNLILNMYPINLKLFYK